MKLGSRSWDWCVEMTPKVKEKVQKSFLFGKGNGGKLLALHIRERCKGEKSIGSKFMTNEYVMRYSLTCLLCVCTTNTNNNSNGMGECCGSLFLSLAPSVPTCTRPWLSYDDQLGVRVSRNGPFYSRPFFVFFFFFFLHFTAQVPAPSRIRTSSGLY